MPRRFWRAFIVWTEQHNRSRQHPPPREESAARIHPPRPNPASLPSLRRNRGRIRGSAQKSGNHVAIFTAGHGAGGVNEATAGRQQLPGGLQQPSLQRGQFVDIRRGLTQANIGMTANHAERRTGRIEQYAVERGRHPTTGRAGRHRRQRLRRANLRGANSRRLSRAALGSMSTAINLLNSGFPFSDQRRLAAGRGAGVEHPLIGSQLQGKGDALGAQVLHRDHARRESGQVLHIAG